MAENRSNRTLREIMRIIASRFLGMLIIFILVVGSVTVATFLAPRWYRSEVGLLAKAARAETPLERTSVLPDEVSLFVVTQREIIMSDYVLASALMRLEGKPIQKAPPDWRPKHYPWYKGGEITDYVKENWKKFKKARKRVDVVTPGGAQAFTQTFTIRVDWPEEPNEDDSVDTRQLAAQRAHQMAEYVKEAYLMHSTNLKSRQAGDAVQFIIVEVAKARDELNNTTQAMQRFIDKDVKGDLLLVRNMAGQWSVGAETGVAKLRTHFTAEINMIDGKLAETGALLRVLKQELALKDASKIAIPDVITEANPVVSAIQAKIVELKLQLNSLQPKFTEDHQEVRNVRHELALAEIELHKEIQKQSRRLEQNIKVLIARRAALKELVNADRKRVDDLASKAATYIKLHSDIDTTKSILEAQQKRLVEAKTAQQLAANPILVSEYDKPSHPNPDNPRRPIVWLNLLIAAAGGIVLSLVYAFLSDHLDHSLKSIDDAQRHVGVPVLTSIPKFRWKFIKLT